MDIHALCGAVVRLKMFPVFDCVHYCMMSIIVKEDIQKSAAFPFARQHPLASWFATMLMCFSSQIWFCLLFNQAFATLLLNPENIAIASAIWYVVNYMPADFVYRFLSVTPFKALLVAMKEVHRVYGIRYGVLLALKKYPGHYLIPVVAGILKGSSYLWMRPIEGFVRGIWAPNNNELLQPSLVLKASVIASAVFTLETYGFIRVEHSILFTATILILMYLRVSKVVLGTRDPFVPFENLICSVFFGGMWDALRRARSHEQLNGGGDSKVKKS